MNEVSGAVRHAPKAPGKAVPDDLPYLFDLVLHASTGKDTEGNTYHYLRTKPDFNTEAKDRSGKLDEIEYPDLNNIFNKVKQDGSIQF